MSEKDQRSHRGRACLAVVAGTGLLLTSLPAIAHAETVVESSTSVPDRVPNLPSAASLVAETTIEAETFAGSVKESTAAISTARQWGNIGFSGDERFIIGSEEKPATAGHSVTANARDQ